MKTLSTLWYCRCQFPVVLRGACLFAIWLGLLKKNENDFSTSFSLIGLSQSI